VDPNISADDQKQSPCSSAIWLADDLRFDEDIDTNLALRPRSCSEVIRNFREFYRRDGGELSWQP